MQQYVWKILFALFWFMTILVSSRIRIWEIDAKIGMSNITFWIGIFLGILIGITSIKLALNTE